MRINLSLGAGASSIPCPFRGFRSDVWSIARRVIFMVTSGCRSVGVYGIGNRHEAVFLGVNWIVTEAWASDIHLSRSPLYFTRRMFPRDHHRTCIGLVASLTLSRADCDRRGLLARAYARLLQRTG